jgi:hypothetical protein
MVRCMKSRRILAGLCALAAMLLGLRDAEAGSSSITITGGYKPGGGDPPFDYIFDIYLNAPTTQGTNTWVSGDSITIFGLPGVDSISGHHEPFVPPPANPTVLWSAGASNTVSTPGGTAPFASDFTWVYTGSTVYMATTPLGGPVGSSIFLGEFTVTSTFDFPAGVLPLADQAPVSYTFEGPPDGGVTLTFPIRNLSVPEPSSAILLSLGAGGLLPTFWLVKRRRPLSW